MLDGIGYCLLVLGEVGYRVGAVVDVCIVDFVGLVHVGELPVNGMVRLMLGGHSVL